MINNHVVVSHHDHDPHVVVVLVPDVRIQQSVAPYAQLYDVQVLDVQDQCYLVSVLPQQQPLGHLGHVSSVEPRSVRIVKQMIV